jgi:hypothetical protein
MRNMPTILSSVLAATLFAAGYGISAPALGDDNPPPPASAPGTDGPRDRHNNPAWQACKKQADDQKLSPGDARRDFMRSCMKSAKQGTPPAPA